MILRPFTLSDLPVIEQLHEKYYPDFGFPNFSNMMNAFVMEDKDDYDRNEIIMAGGVEMVAESSLVTNKSVSRIKIGRALVEAQQIAIFTCKKYGIKELYAFVNNDDYAEHLIKHGFAKHGLIPLSMKVL